LLAALVATAAPAAMRQPVPEAAMLAAPEVAVALEAMEVFWLSMLMDIFRKESTTLTAAQAAKAAHRGTRFLSTGLDLEKTESKGKKGASSFGSKEEISFPHVISSLDPNEICFCSLLLPMSFGIEAPKAGVRAWAARPAASKINSAIIREIYPPISSSVSQRAPILWLIRPISLPSVMVTHAPSYLLTLSVEGPGHLIAISEADDQGIVVNR
jgi:hypothetical protein